MYFDDFPKGPHYRFANATVSKIALDPADRTGDLTKVDFTVENGRITKLAAAGTVPAPEGLPVFDMQDGMVWPVCAELHTHLDKGQTLPRVTNPTGTHANALDLVAADRDAYWSAEDVEARMDFALRCAYAQGTALIRTHIDSFPPQGEESWPVFSKIRDRWKGKVELQGSPLVPLIFYADMEGSRKLADLAHEHGGLLGAAAKSVEDPDPLLDRVFSLAVERDMDIDIHADETDDINSNALAALARKTIEYGWQGRVTAGHCCALAVQSDNVAKETMALVAEAGVTVVSLPMCNMYLQGRGEGITPRWRGVTLLQELADAGASVAVSSDNTRDPFFAYGDLDPVEVFTQSVRIAQLDLPVGPWFRAITRTPAEVMRRPDMCGLAEGGPADFILHRTRNWTELLARPRDQRLVVRNGLPLSDGVPDYRELDRLFA